MYLLRPHNYDTSVHSYFYVRCEYIKIFYRHDDRIYVHDMIRHYRNIFSKELDTAFDLITGKRLYVCATMITFRQIISESNIEDNSPRLCVIQRRHSKQDTQITWHHWHSQGYTRARGTERRRRPDWLTTNHSQVQAATLAILAALHSDNHVSAVISVISPAELSLAISLWLFIIYCTARTS